MSVSVCVCVCVCVCACVCVVCVCVRMCVCAYVCVHHAVSILLQLDLSHYTFQVNIVAESVHMTAATITNATTLSGDHVMHSSIATHRENSKPVLKIPQNPFDQAFAKAEIDSPHRTTRKSYQTNTKSYNVATKGTFRQKEVLESEVREKVDNEATAEMQEHNQNTMLQSMAEPPTDDGDSGAEVEFGIIKQASVTDDDKDILNGAQKITLSSVTEIMASSETSPSGFVHYEVAATESITVATSNGIQPDDTLVNGHGLHLDLSCDQNGGEDCPQDEGKDDEQPKSKLPVAETPLDFDRPLPTKYHNFPHFAEVQELLGRIPTFPEYMAYRLNTISKDIESRYPELDKHIQQIISAIGSTLTYDLFQKAALKVQSQAKKMCDGMFMVLQFGRQLFHDFPEAASNFTTQWVNEYIVYQGGWVSCILYCCYRRVGNIGVVKLWRITL